MFLEPLFVKKRWLMERLVIYGEFEMETWATNFWPSSVSKDVPIIPWNRNDTGPNVPWFEYQIPCFP